MTEQLHPERDPKMKPFEMYRERFRAVYDAVALRHRESSRAHRGHGLDHDVTVATHALLIAANPRAAEKAFVASMLHSMDHLVGESIHQGGDHKKVGEAIRECLSHLPANYFNPAEIEEIFDADMRHEELLPSGQSSETLELLQDADRLTNLMPSWIIRAGQFQPHLPAIEFEHLDGTPNPQTTYSSPRSVLDDLRITLASYRDKFHTERAKEIGRKYIEMVENYISSVERTYEELGLSNVRL